MSGALFALNIIKNGIPLNIRKIIYNSLNKLQMKYAAVAWECSNNSKIKKNMHSDPIFII